MQEKIFMVSKLIEIARYDNDWPIQFEEEAAVIKKALGDNCMDIHHIGSTSVVGLSGKPIIDIIVVSSNPSASIQQLESLGYEYKGELNIPFRFYFSRPGFHLHMYMPDSPEVQLNLMFRDYLRSHLDACLDYMQLKQKLSDEQKHYKDAPPMFSHYTLGKNDFIRKILQQLGFDRLRLMHCTHYTEWEAAKIFRQKYFFDKVAIADPYTWTFNHSDHVHFVLYKGSEIIGYAHLQKWPKCRAAMRIIVINEDNRGKGFGSYLLEQCEKWLRMQGIKSIHIEASPEAETFYRHFEYVDMPFNDPGNYPSDSEDIQLGKIL